MRGVRSRRRRPSCLSSAAMLHDDEGRRLAGWGVDPRRSWSARSQGARAASGCPRVSVVRAVREASESRKNAESKCTPVHQIRKRRFAEEQQGNNFSSSTSISRKVRKDEEDLDPNCEMKQLQRHKKRSKMSRENGMWTRSKARLAARRVGFGSVEIREMYVTIGESSVSQDGGPPIGISPRMKRAIVRNVDSFESERESGRSSKQGGDRPVRARLGRERYKTEGRLPAELRREILVRSEANRAKIEEAEAESQRILMYREQSTFDDPDKDSEASWDGGITETGKIKMIPSQDSESSELINDEIHAKISCSIGSVEREIHSHSSTGSFRLSDMF